MNEAFIANQNLDSAIKKSSKVHDSVSEMLIGMRSDSRDFYYRIALLSGGVLSLDVTFIGYLSSNSATNNFAVQFAELLYLSWFFLIFALIGSLYRNHYNLDLGHYQLMNTLNKAYLEQFEAKQQLLKHNPSSFINLKTQEAIIEEIERTEKDIKSVKKAININGQKEKTSSRSWIISEWFAHTGFAIGIILTTVFAGLNLPVNMEFTIINFIQKFI